MLELRLKIVKESGTLIVPCVSFETIAAAAGVVYTKELNKKEKSGKSSIYNSSL